MGPCDESAVLCWYFRIGIVAQHAGSSTLGFGEGVVLGVCHCTSAWGLAFRLLKAPGPSLRRRHSLPKHYALLSLHGNQGSATVVLHVLPNAISQGRRIGQNCTTTTKKNQEVGDAILCCSFEPQLRLWLLRGPYCLC